MSNETQDNNPNSTGNSPSNNSGTPNNRRRPPRSNNPRPRHNDNRNRDGDGRQSRPHHDRSQERSSHDRPSQDRSSYDRSNERSNSSENRGERPNHNNRNRRSNNGGGNNRGRGGHNGRSSSPSSARSPIPRNFKSSPTGTYTNIKDALAANQKMQEDRLNAPAEIGNANAWVRIVPLGGLGQVGGNMAVIETENSAVIVDVGLSFPDESMHGVDILIPDFSYLRQIKNKIDGVIITHAHEDHIGAMAYLFGEMQFPVYGTPLPLEMIAAKFDEHKLQKHKKLFNYVEKRRIIQIGDFEVEWMHVTHSILDSSAVAITSEAGTLIHTGDFKFDNTPVDGFCTDYHRLAHYGEKGVLCMFSDSTNSHNPGMTLSEKTVRPVFENIFKNATGRIIMSTFSSNIHRVYQAMEVGLKFNRRICVIGRSMEKNIQIALDTGHIRIDPKMFIEPHEINKVRDSEVLVVTTGSQGEPMSALYRMSIGEHRHIRLKPQDTVVLSSKAIPGNEPLVSGLINQIERCGAQCIHYGVNNLHVSGHAAQEEQKFMIRFLKPKYFLPIHGEYQHRAKHLRTAIDCGVPERNTMLVDDGDIVEISSRYMKKVKSVRVGKVFIDNQRNNVIENSIVYDRQTLANDGIVTIVLQISEQDHAVIGKPRVTTHGLVAQRREHAFTKELEDVLAKFVDHCKPSDLQQPRAIENNLRQVLKKHIYRQLRKYPIIVPNIFIQ